MPPKIPPYVNGLRAFLKSEADLHAKLQKFTSHKAYLKDILEDYEYFCKFIAPLETYQAANIFTRLGDYREIDDKNFAERIDVLYELICKGRYFSENNFSLFTTLTLNYGDYVERLLQQQQNIDTKANIYFKKNPRVAKYFQQDQYAHGDINNYLQNYLIQPIQRIGQYALQIKAILDTMPHKHPSRQKVAAIYRRTRVLAGRANSVEITPKPLKRMPSGQLRSPITPGGVKLKFQQLDPAQKRPRSKNYREPQEALPAKNHCIQALPLVANALRLVDFYTDRRMRSVLKVDAYARDGSLVKSLKGKSQAVRRVLDSLERELINLYLREGDKIATKKKAISDIIQHHIDRLDRCAKSAVDKKVKRSLMMLKNYHDGVMKDVGETLSKSLFDMNSTEFTAEKYIQKHFLMKVVSPFADYNNNVCYGFFRRFFTTKPEKKRAAKAIINQLDSAMQKKLPVKGIWHFAANILKRNVHKDDNFVGIFAQKQFGVALKGAENYLNKVKPATYKTAKQMIRM